MGKIYQKSAAVVVWLGKDRDDTEEIRDSIQQLAGAGEAHIDAMVSDNGFTSFPPTFYFLKFIGKTSWHHVVSEIGLQADGKI
jgi:hypothetical protein